MPPTKRSSSAKLSRECKEFSSGQSVPYSSYRTLMRGSQQDDFKMSEYINRASGATKLDDDVGQLDHTYARSSYWHPQNHFMKPCRYLYSLMDARKSTSAINDLEISPDLVCKEFVVPLLDECPSVSEQSDSDPEDRQSDGEGCWEEDISKIGWSPVQIRILPKVVHLLDEVHLTRLASKGRSNEIIFIDNALKGFSSQLSHYLASVGWDKQITQWLHALLLKNLSPKQKKDYMILLAMVRKRLPIFVDRMLIPVHVGRSSFNKDADRFPIANLPKCTDRVAEILINEKLKKLPGGPVFLLIPNSVETENCERFKLIVNQLHQMAEVHIVALPPAAGITMKQHLDRWMTEVRTRLGELSSDYAGRPIVLVGWMLGASLACLAAQLEPVSVQAVICMGFPMKTVEASGNVLNSSTLDINCPILFVIGAKSKLASREEVEEARSAMDVPNHLVLVGSCNDRFVMNRKDMNLFGVTQTMIDRSIVVEIYNFVGELLTQPPPSPPQVVHHSPKDASVPSRRVAAQAKKKSAAVKINVLTSKKQFKPPPVKQPKTIVGGNGKVRMTTTQSTVSLSKNKATLAQTQSYVINSANSAKYTVLLTHNYAANL